VSDAYVAKLTLDGSTLIYSTYLGGNNVEQTFGLAIDAMGNAFVCGDTKST